MRKKLFIDVYKYYIEQGCELLILEENYISVDTKMIFMCNCGNIHENTFSNFKAGNRCKRCGIKKISKNGRLSHDFVFNYYKEHGYFMTSTYTICKNKDKLTCPNYHDVEITFDNFKSGYRCGICFRENWFGENHPNYNLNIDEISLNYRLRIPHTKSWSIKHMVDDKNYVDFLKKPHKYVLDHKIPVKLFCELFTKYNLNETKVRKIINKKDNLQLLTWSENWDKSIKGSTLFEASNYLINNGIPFETFLEERKSYEN